MCAGTSNKYSFTGVNALIRTFSAVAGILSVSSVISMTGTTITG